MPTLERQPPRPAAADPQFMQLVRAGLAQPQKTLPTQYLYDAQGSALFDAICELDEYYPTRTELGIMVQHLGELAARVGPDCAVIEYGSGSGLKTAMLLEKLKTPTAFVPVEFSRAYLEASARVLRERFPALEILPVCADFTRPFARPVPKKPPAKWLMFFPGSTIGNFAPERARALLQHMREQVGPRGMCLIGVDMHKSAAVLERAYNDALGVTAAFNLNLLRRCNRELGANFRLEQFEHHAVYIHPPGRVEMRLVSTVSQTVTVHGQTFSLRRGEWIHTESSYKYSLDAFTTVAQGAGWSSVERWVDAQGMFGVYLLQTAAN